MHQLHFHFAESVLDALAILFPHRTFEAWDETPRPEGVVDSLRRDIPPAPAVEPSMDQPSL
jgi:hypothetical protein